MSTKCTIKYGDDFHFYNECFDEENVYLDLDNGMWEANSNGSVTVAIPKAVWATIRESAPVDLPYAYLTDEELEAKVNEEVDKRIDEYNNETNERMKHLSAFFGSMTYGLVTDPREEQIKNGIESFKLWRERQRKIADQIAEYNKSNKR